MKGYVPACRVACANATVLQHGVDPKLSRVNVWDTELSGALFEEAVAITTNAGEERVNESDRVVMPVFWNDAVVKEALVTPIPPIIGNSAPSGL